MRPPRASDIVIQRAGLVDVPAVAPLFDAYRQFYGLPSDLASARDFLAARLARDESVVLLAYRGEASASSGRVHEGVPAGFAQLYPSFSSLALGAIVVLNDLFVAPACRGAGVARALVEAAAAHARRAGAVRLELATQHTNTPARRLYASLGFGPDTEFEHLSLCL